MRLMNMSSEHPCQIRDAKSHLIIAEIRILEFWPERLAPIDRVQINFNLNKKIILDGPSTVSYLSGLGRMDLDISEC